MAIFIDTGKIDEIKRFLAMGIIRGGTINPTILFKDGVRGGVEGVRERAREIAGVLKPYPLSVEVTTNNHDEMIEQAKDFADLADNINIKIPIHGPEGELFNVEVIHTLESKLDIRVNATAMMSSQQCFLAAMAGATYVSLFGGRVNNMGYNCIDEIRRLRRLLDAENLKSKIIIGSTREILNIVEWLDAGAHIVTVVPALLEGMLVHPYSKETVQMFLRDAGRIHETR